MFEAPNRATNPVPIRIWRSAAAAVSLVKLADTVFAGITPAEYAGRNSACWAIARTASSKLTFFRDSVTFRADGTTAGDPCDVTATLDDLTDCAPRAKGNAT